jgi:hypothetical protein
MEILRSSSMYGRRLKAARHGSNKLVSPVNLATMASMTSSEYVLHDKSIGSVTKSSWIQVDNTVKCEVLVEQRSIYIHLCVGIGICKHSLEVMPV